MERNESDNVSMNPPARSGATGDLITVLIVAAAIGLVGYNFGIVSPLKVLLGLSFVIFIHEMGHFLVAKACDVNVSHFSIGFGPVIPGCSFQWGETMYQICLLPLGGYVQMLGQVDGDESSDGSENDPRSYRNKSVGQRMAIISAGVIMNVILALVIFIAVFRIPGKERKAPVIGEVDPGGPAYVAGIRTGMEIKQIGSYTHPYFDDLMYVVSSSSAGEKIQIEAQRHGDPKALSIVIEPRKSKTDAQPVLGVTTASAAAFGAKRDFQPDVERPVVPGSSADRASPAFDFGDIIIATTDPKNPETILALPDDPYKPEQKDVFEFQRRMQLLADKDVVIRVRRPSGDVDVKVPPTFRWSIGAVMEMGNIIAVRKGSSSDGKIQLPEAASADKKFVNGDLIEKVEVVDADGKTLVFEKEKLDPERLPFDLKSWARRLTAANKMAEKPIVSLFVRRHRQEGGQEFVQTKVDLEWDNGWEFDRTIPISLQSPIAIPELGIAYHAKTTVAHVTDPASQLQVGDVVTAVRVTIDEVESKKSKPEWSPKDALKPEEWANTAFIMLQITPKIEKIEFKVMRNGAVKEVEVAAKVDPTWSLATRGWFLASDTRIQKADTTLEAIGFGLQDTQRQMRGVFNGLRNLVVGRLDYRKHLGGPLRIMNIAYQIAGRDFWEFLFFLGMISVNLAVINFLPIPLLDGGHMVFLVYEKLRGKAASEGVRIVATYMGLAFIACLMLLVTYLDIGRFWWGTS